MALPPATLYRRLTMIPYPMADWQDWADTFVGFNPVLRSRISPDMPWEEFAVRLGEIERLTPPPESFATWQDWVVALKTAVPVPT